MNKTVKNIDILISQFRIINLKHEKNPNKKKFALF